MIQKHKLILDDDYKMAISSKEKSLCLWIDGGCYAFGEDGKMYSDCFTPNGFRANESGK
ncbi:N-acetylmuramoyl-L-alanine amidase [Clostridium saccharoperbutylacetonicum]|uniref:Uncharacterized protein n=1 Tax=Clostridium saccharoperbutylacetonicum N1-4(HMT) TaxID=931276 RepID=M1MLR7_9CLOT|nr:hypothetical protein [Clostridium saccharoperbutylacetonicum]AGF55716.1 hypothetical protein Cspa_c19500 [Clostridium saccharoperbutylacetonicum N1-4(HMT)]NRT63555.1 N-acetylmuramoyl-L-alanine amidase [Clostridium saccharoperbutylacetonicum]NSB26918.1 N-acetylmuramoyl-L-alanine amidase [Clostridium saccharoperbutylacetonicum]NSB40402.1 N-acetylmuramoyl-L-alanine amidase [Clostridium saccharoperbutylacetonicum]